jgi:NTE family protein
MPWKLTATLVIAAALAISAPGQQPDPLSAGSVAPAAISPLPAVQPSNRPSIGLALEGGGALGIAHIGVLKWFEEHRIPIDRLAGTSMGALVGSLYATGHTPAQLQLLATGNSFSSVFTLQTPYSDVSFRRRQDRHELPQAVTLGLRHGAHVRNALFANRGIDRFLRTQLFVYNSRQLDFNDIPIPFRCVATDLTNRQPVTFADGPLPDAVRASISIPGVFSPVQTADGHYLVDGGILDNLPTGALRRDLHADTVIAVRLIDGPFATKDVQSIVAVLNRAFSAGVLQNVQQAEGLADIVIRVPLEKFTTTDYVKAQDLIDAGYNAAQNSAAALLPYALSQAGWQAYLEARLARGRPEPGLLRQLQVEGASPAAIREVKADMKPLAGQPIQPAPTFNALHPIQSNGGIAAAWETFSPASSAPAPAQPPLPDTGIRVRLHNDSTGPPYLLVGPDVAAATANLTRTTMSLRFIDQNFGGFGSELRATARIGSMADLSAEYYRLLSPNGYFLEPRAALLRQPVYIWANQKRIAERFQQNLVAGLVVGRTFTPHLQVSAEWRAQDTHWTLTTGAGGGPNLYGTAQTGLLHIVLDKASAGAVSPDGFRLALAAGALYHASASANAPLVQFAFSRTRPWLQNNIVGLSADINSYLRANVAQPFRFTLGGPQRLSASSFDEFRGTDTALVRAGVLHRIAAMPIGLGQGLYAVLAYGAGEIWSPENRSILRQDGTTGLLANTPLGVITLGVSVGDAGRRKVFFTVGRVF